MYPDGLEAFQSATELFCFPEDYEIWTESSRHHIGVSLRDELEANLLDQYVTISRNIFETVADVDNDTQVRENPAFSDLQQAAQCCLELLQKNDRLAGQPKLTVNLPLPHPS
jgi:pyruvate-formate lyase